MSQRPSGRAYACFYVVCVCVLADGNFLAAAALTDRTLSTCCVLTLLLDSSRKWLLRTVRPRTEPWALWCRPVSGRY